jgi:hypothetical protein
MVSESDDNAVERYEHFGDYMESSPHGEWVSYEDYQALAAERDALQTDLSATLKREQDANERAMDHLRRATAAEAQLAKAQQSLTVIDALDPESMANGCSQLVLIGLVSRMGAIARETLALLDTPTPAPRDEAKTILLRDIEVIRCAVARGWCTPKNSDKPMDFDIVEAMVQSVLPFVSITPAPSPYDLAKVEALLEAAKGVMCHMPDYADTMWMEFVAALAAMKGGE